MLSFFSFYKHLGKQRNFTKDCKIINCILVFCSSITLQTYLKVDLHFGLIHPIFLYKNDLMILKCNIASKSIFKYHVSFYLQINLIRMSE